MVHAEHAREGRLVRDGRRQVPVTLSPRGLGKHRRKSPVLSAREAFVGRGAYRHPIGEQRLSRPRVVAVGVDAHRQVQPQAEAFVIQALPEIAELAAGQSLRHEVETLLLRVYVVGLQRSCKSP